MFSPECTITVAKTFDDIVCLGCFHSSLRRDLIPLAIYFFLDVIAQIIGQLLFVVFLGDEQYHIRPHCELIVANFVYGLEELIAGIRCNIFYNYTPHLLIIIGRHTGPYYGTSLTLNGGIMQ